MLTLPGEVPVPEVPPRDGSPEPGLEVDAAVQLQRGGRVPFCAGPVSQLQVDGCAVQGVRGSGGVEVDRGGEVRQRRVEVVLCKRSIALPRTWSQSTCIVGL